MAMSTINVSLPFVVAGLAAGAGIYFLDRNHYKQKEIRGGIRTSIENFMTQAKVEVSNTQMPKLAPQFDGLDSFETLVVR
ncbi:hypothetical protein RchiOBHm_Chr1g0382821 [Rosa chinensis]|uniref:Uncharacterized protein n=1 Tax=Rosa chinensis TaxID=74649 RepID=A0A2P6SPJ3_ROSCH|nr:hypothetical protein RchiOBHm_Chr1g0382821 [Rosa chinensis]